MRLKNADEFFLTLLLWLSGTLLYDFFVSYEKVDKKETKSPFFVVFRQTLP